MTQPTEQDHEFIYLQPACCADENVGRLWCEDPDPEGCEDGAKWTEYVRADVHAALQARVAELEKREAAYDIILKVVSNALERAGATECDNPGDAIEMIAKERDRLKEICAGIDDGERWYSHQTMSAVIAERDGLLSQLPEGMKHCTIIFKECDKGHGWLTATNWVQHGCPKCEFDRIVDEKHELQRLRRQSSNMVSALHLEACQWRLKAEKAEQERDGLAAKCAEQARYNVQSIANRICGEIPDEFHIEMVLENGAGWVSLFHKGKPVEIDMADWGIAEQFDVAMQCIQEILGEQQ